MKWHKIFPLCSLHKEKVLCRQAPPLTGLITPIMYYGIKFSLCAFTQGENLTPLGHIKLVAARQGEFQWLQSTWIHSSCHAVVHPTSWPEWDWCLQHITPLQKLEGYQNPQEARLEWEEPVSATLLAPIQGAKKLGMASWLQLYCVDRAPEEPL